MALFVPDPENPLSAADLIDDLGRVLAERYANAEDELIREVAQRAYRDLQLQSKIRTADAAVKAGLRSALDRNRQLAELAGERATALRDLQFKAVQVVGRLRDEGLAEEIIRVASEHGEAEAAARLGMASRLPATTTLNATSTSAATQLVLSLQSRLEELHMRITRYPRDAFQRIVAMTSPNVLLGASTQLRAQQQAVQMFLREGITGFVDKADRRWKIGSYAEMAGRTSVARAFNDAGIARMQSSDINLVTIVGSLSSCRRCAPWVGKILSTDGTTGTVTLPHATDVGDVSVDIFATLDAARSGGLFHPNCSHRAVGYLPGLAIPQANFKYDEAADKARERQREIEVEIRSAKRDQSVAANDIEARKAARRIKDRQQALSDHLEATGRKRASYREQLHFADGKGAPASARPLALAS
ncbi:hypothetical protein BH09ACT9_BH09ACT9_00630 [soil metagenome]